MASPRPERGRAACASIQRRSSSVACEDDAREDDFVSCVMFEMARRNDIQLQMVRNDENERFVTLLSRNDELSPANLETIRLWRR
ncbi:MAG TPA: hypothetical protein VEB21_20390, partial [Terriglobales bacterium]|nr:hypothetical protein [Terriglobales bacterium]